MAAHLINRTPTPVLNEKSPYEVLHGSPPSYDFLHVFGCLCYAHRRSRDKDKFGNRSRKCLFVGYPYGKKAWQLYDIERNEFFSSRDVMFLEDELPGLPDDYSSPIVPPAVVSSDDWMLPVEDISSTPAPPEVSGPPYHLEPTTTASPVSPTTPEVSRPLPQPEPTDSAAPIHSSEVASPTPPTAPDLPEPSSPGLPELLGRGHRQRLPSVLLKNFVTNTASLSIPPSLDPSSSLLGSSDAVSGNTLYPISHYVSDANYSPGHKAFLAAVTSGVEPSSYYEAAQDEVWCDSMHDEYNAMGINKAWLVTT